MTRTAADSTSLASLEAIPPATLAGIPVLMGYDDGHWPDASSIAATFPGKTVVRITVDPADNEGDMLDVETGDATPADAPGWVTRRRQAGHRGPLVYFSDAIRTQVVDAFSSAGVALPGLFAAAYPGPGAVLIDPATDVGHQYTDTGTYDLSVVVDYLPGIDPAPAPPPKPPEAIEMPVSPMVQFRPGQLDAFQVNDGGVVHKWVSDGNQLHTEVLDSGIGGVAPPTPHTFPDQTPGVSILNGLCYVMAEDADGHVHQFTQGQTGGWGHNVFP